MSKITFRADDDLVGRLEAFDASKSEVMRDALRQYLDTEERETRVNTTDTPTRESDTGSLGALIDERIDRVVAERVDAALSSRPAATTDDGTDVSVNISLDGVDEGVTADEHTVERKTDIDDGDTQSSNSGCRRRPPGMRPVWRGCRRRARLLPELRGEGHSPAVLRVR
jgi:hypothetical protein